MRSRAAVCAKTVIGRLTMRIGILTGGGDVPGLNQCIKALTSGASELGWEVLGIRRGWTGLLHIDFNASDEANRTWVERLTPEITRTIDRSGGTILHTSRLMPDRVPIRELPTFLQDHIPSPAGASVVDCTDQILRAIEHLGIDAIVAIGGDDTLAYAVRLHREGVSVITIPKTMDNDVHGTDYCLGFSTAVGRSVDFIHALRTPAGSHERIAVVELFGRRSGETSLIASYLADVDRALITEVPFDVDRLAALLAEDKARNPSNYAMVTVSEGATMVGSGSLPGGPSIGAALGVELKRRTGAEIINQQLAYLMRAGTPDALDRMVAVSFGRLCIGMLHAGTFGRMVALQSGVYTTVPVETCVLGDKRVDIDELYDSEQYRPRVSHLLGKPMFLY